MAISSKPTSGPECFLASRDSSINKLWWTVGSKYESVIGQESLVQSLVQSQICEACAEQVAKLM
jgi:hypothetical protein